MSNNKESEIEEHLPSLNIPPEIASALVETAQAFFEFLMKKWGFRDPIEMLEECLEHREWFKGIVLSTAFFEGVGKKVLIDHFKDKIEPEKFEHLRLEQIIMFLYASKIIDQSTYSKMIEVNKFRNDIVHLDEPFTEIKLKPKEAEKIIEKAIDCLKPLIEKLFESEGKEEIFKLPPRPIVEKKEK